MLFKTAISCVSAAFVLSVYASLACASELPSKDVKQGTDSAVISRFSGSVIVGYQQVGYDEMDLPAGPLNGSKIDKTIAVNGKITRIVYAVPAGKTAAEVMANFRTSLQQGGFKLGYQCGEGTGATGCGGYNFAQAFAAPIMSSVSATRNTVIDLLYSTDDNVRYQGAQLQRGGDKMDVGLMVAKDGDEPVGVLLQIVESGAMQTGEVTVDSAAMSKGLLADGKIALYGLHFGSDSAVLKPDSDVTLKQMSDLLHQQPALKVFIVGHTDNSGVLAHNTTLSQQRADAVVKALTSRYGISGARLATKGLASFSPVASNHSDAGKAKNRRVELVEQ